MTPGSFASSPRSRSAGGHEEQPWLVKSSTTARGSACADAIPVPATIANAAESARRRCIPSPLIGSKPRPTIRAAHEEDHSIRGERHPSERESRRQAAQHVLQDAAVAEIIEL